MNALAKFSVQTGYDVSGSDAHIGEFARSVGASVYEGADGSGIEGADAVIYTAAVTPSHVELRAAERLGVPAYPRQAMLGEVSALFERSVAVAGTHGKTTVTAMLSHILMWHGARFVAMIGGESVDFSNYVNNRVDLGADEDMRRGLLRKLSGEDSPAYRALKSKLIAGGGIFVTEACEYRRSFLRLEPYIGIVTNVDHDHPDCYPTARDVREAFDAFVARCRISVAGDDRRADEAYAVRLRGAGIDARVCALANGELIANGKSVCALKLPLGGGYNMQNALYAISAAYALGIDVVEGAQALESFGGVKRRFEHCGDVDGAKVIFDFAHHPTEIGCAVSRARAMGRVLTVFQPHTYSRTKAYLDGFAAALGDGDGELVLMPTYAAREQREAGVDSDALLAAIRSAYPRKRAYLASSAEETLDMIRSLAGGYDVVLMLGAGDIYALKDRL